MIKSVCTKERKRRNPKVCHHWISQAVPDLWINHWVPSECFLWILVHSEAQWLGPEVEIQVSDNKNTNKMREQNFESLSNFSLLWVASGALPAREIQGEPPEECTRSS